VEDGVRSIWDSEWESEFSENYADTPCLKLLPAFCSNALSAVEHEIEEGLFQRYDSIESLSTAGNQAGNF
jgi:hypothetical protein